MFISWSVFGPEPSFPEVFEGSDPKSFSFLRFMLVFCILPGRGGAICVLLTPNGESLDLTSCLSRPTEVVASSAARTVRSTRAGGQDDGSLIKLARTSRCLYACSHASRINHGTTASQTLQDFKSRAVTEHCSPNMNTCSARPNKCAANRNNRSACGVAASSASSVKINS